MRHLPHSRPFLSFCLMGTKANMTAINMKTILLLALALMTMVNARKGSLRNGRKLSGSDEDEPKEIATTSHASATTTTVWDEMMDKLDNVSQSWKDLNAALCEDAHEEHRRSFRQCLFLFSFLFVLCLYMFVAVDKTRPCNPSRWEWIWVVQRRTPSNGNKLCNCIIKTSTESRHFERAHRQWIHVLIFGSGGLAFLGCFHYAISTIAPTYCPKECICSNWDNTMMDATFFLLGLGLLRRGYLEYANMNKGEIMSRGIMMSERLMAPSSSDTNGIPIV